MKAAEDVPSVDQGKSQLNDGEFAAAVDIFTQILATHPQDSLIYRLRGDAYDNLGDQQKALEDWTQAARLGDTIYSLIWTPWRSSGEIILLRKYPFRSCRQVYLVMDADKFWVSGPAANDLVVRH